MFQRVLMIILILAVVIFGGFYAYNELVPNNDVAEAQGPIYSTQDVVKGNISVGVDTSGRVNETHGGGIKIPGDRYSGTQINYVIEKVFVEDGDSVKKDQLLVRLSSPDLDSKIKEAKDRLKSKREQLADMTGVSIDEVDDINPSKGITIKSPIDGRVINLDAEEGDELKLGHVVSRIVDDSKFIVRAKVSPVEYKLVKAGSEVELKFANFEGTYKAIVKEINKNAVPDVDNNGTAKGFVHWMTIEGDNPGLIQPNMQVQVGVRDEVNKDTVLFFTNQGNVEGFGEEKRVLNRAEGIVTQVFVHNMDIIKKGDNIVSMAGADMQKSIQDKLDEIFELKRQINDLNSKFDNLDVKASMDGMIGYLEAEEGESARAGGWIGSIFDTGRMMMWTQVDDIDILNVKQDAPVEVTVDAMPGEVFEGKVMHVNTRGDNNNGVTNYEVSIEVYGNEKLKPGMQANAFIDAGSAEGVLLIPLEALFEEDGKSMVEVLQEDGSAKLTQVKIGLMNDREAEVTEGLKEGDKVITGSSADLLPSQHIKSKDPILPDKNDDNNDGSDNNDDSESNE
ncbi:efflux RND transporter periplasmic adaptor subunit [Abyssisolibacter fermentans]|uniref:efflux RND transporter periplasmic adaptor subunit n=1 Tax=Abyssisolibacter fermentans TaxID=1766203 RepID=UPI00082F04BC|nr:efflux RND transporter periplasmic adaptor subunit [Abyssisolibacter fermentans]